MRAKPTLIISFPEASVAEANWYASSLADVLRDVDPSVSVESVRERMDTQDFGATLLLALGTASASAIAKGISTWIARTGTKIEIKKDGSVLATGLDSKDAARIAEALGK